MNNRRSNRHLQSVCKLFAILIAFTVICSLSTGCSLGDRFVGRPSEVSIPGGEAVLPVDWWCDLAVIPTFVDGEGPFNFLLDTGASESVVSPAVAARLSEQTFSIDRATRGTSGNRIGVDSALAIGELRLGATRFQDIDALVIDLTGPSDALGLVLDGILGCPLFEGSVLRIDYPGQEVSVRTGSLPAGKREDQFTVTGATRPHVALTIGGETMPVLVDSGSRGGLSLAKDVFAKQKFAAGPVVASASVGITGQPHLWRAARLVGRATIGPHILDEPVVQEKARESQLGGKVLRHFVVTFDAGNRRVRLERAEASELTMEPLRLTGIQLRRRPEGSTIWQILPYATDAAQDLHPGDAVTHVAGIPAAELGCADLRELFASRAEITYRVVRDSVTMDVTLPVTTVVP